MILLLDAVRVRLPYSGQIGDAGRRGAGLHVVGGNLRRRASALLLFAALLFTGWPPQMAHADRPLKLVALGDSLTAGYRLPVKAAFPAVLERVLRGRGHDVAIENAGVSGDTVTSGLERLDWSVPDGTDGVILELGANDMLRGVDPEVTRKGLEAILARLKERGIPVLLAGMRASANLGPDYVARFDAIYPDLAERHGLILYPFFLQGVATDPAYNLDDGLHPTSKGVERIVEGILPAVERFLSGLGAGRR